MENVDIVATLCIIIIANAVKIFFKKDRDLGDNGPDLGYKWSPSCIIARANYTSEDPDGFRNFFESLYLRFC